MITHKDINLTGMDVMFELTRWCNMECSHCIRGDKQRIRIKKEHITSVLMQFSEIGTISLSGGEPALAVDLIDYVRDVCYCYRISVDNFWMATNGTVTSKKFFNSIIRWVNFCENNEITGLRISIDDYHERIDVYPFKELEEYSGLPMYFEYSGAPESLYLIGDGRALKNYYTKRVPTHDLHYNDGNIEGTLYINAKGNVLSTCDLSYHTGDYKKSKFYICDCTEDISEGLAKFFNKNPELIYE